MTLAFVAFLAGILTILAPCVLPLLPVIIGGSIADKKSSWKNALVVVVSLGLSIIAFTLLLKATTALLGVPQYIWQIVSGSLVIVLGLLYLFPKVWDGLSLKSGFGLSTQKTMARASSSGRFSSVLTGVALGPVFSSCSPTYAFIVAAVLPASLVEGLLYLILYVFGLCGALLILALAGQRVIHKLGWAVNPHGMFRQIVGILFIVVGVLVLIGGDKTIQEAILESGVYEPIESLESSLR